ncbi:MAG: glutathione S-transferase C-terminal domain-containing protein, partial [Myxococcota bacterium]
AGEADRVSSRYSTPLLCKGRLRVSDSREIVRYVDATYGDAQLFAPSEAEALDREYAVRLGPHTRRIVYWFGLGQPGMLFALARDNVPRSQALLFRASYPLGRRFLGRALAVNEEGYRASLEKVARVADEVAERLADGRPYLCGERFSVADLGFASMMAPAVLPPEYGAELPSPDALAPEAQAIVRRYRAHPAGAFALRMFREHRPPRAGGRAA